MYSLSIEEIPARPRRHPSYDINVIALVHLDQHYFHRACMFGKFGLLNIKESRVHLLLVGSNYESVQLAHLLEFIPSSIDVTFLACECAYPTPKVNAAYLWLRNTPVPARWHLRVDDDSITDIHTTLRYLESRFEGQSIHLMTSSLLCRETTRQFLPFLPNPIAEYTHEYECSATSGRAFESILNNAKAVDFLEKSGRNIHEPGDIALTYAARIAGVPVGEATIFTKDFCPSQLSLLPFAKYSHIHFVPWYREEFLEALQIFVHGVRQPITVQCCQKILNRTGWFGRCIGERLGLLSLNEDGTIHGQLAADESTWRQSGNTLVFGNHSLKPATVFTEMVESDTSLWLFGNFLYADVVHFLQFPLDE